MKTKEKGFEVVHTDSHGGGGWGEGLDSQGPHLIWLDARGRMLWGSWEWKVLLRGPT